MQDGKAIIGMLAVFVVLPLASAWLIRRWLRRRRDKREFGELFENRRRRLRRRLDFCAEFLDGM